jgi:hypothetical protein
MLQSDPANQQARDQTIIQLEQQISRMIPLEEFEALKDLCHKIEEQANIRNE